MREGSQRSSSLPSIPPWTHTYSIASAYDNGIMLYMRNLSKTELKVFKKLLNEHFLPDSLGFTWEQLDRASWAEMVHLLIEFLPGAQAWDVAQEILNRMNQRGLCSLAHTERMNKIQEYKQRVLEETHPVWDNTMWPGNQADFLYSRVEDHEAMLPCLFLPRGPQGRQPKTVVIHGIPGIGKTTLARKMMVQWARNEFYAHKFKFAFYFHCRELHRLGEFSFSELIERQRLRPRALVSKILSRPDQLLLLLDGFEELTFPLITGPAGLMEDWNQKLPGPVLLSSLLSKRMLPEATLLIMVRSTSWRGIKLLVKYPFHVTLTGFNRIEALNYLRLYFTSKTISDQAVDFAKKNSTLLSMCRVPVVCWVVCCCLRTQIQKMVDLTKACPNATSVFVLYLANLLPTIFKKLPYGDYQQQLEGMCCLAAQGMWNLKSVFDKRDFQCVMVDETTIDTFLYVNILRKLEGQGDRYVFALFTFQEIFCALFYILYFPERMKCYYPLSFMTIWNLITFSRERTMYGYQMGLFLFGLFNEECAGIVMRSFQYSLCLRNKLNAISVITRLKDYEGYEYSQLFHCLCETREEAYVKYVLLGYQKVSLKIKNQEDLQTSAFCLKLCRDLKKMELIFSRNFYNELWPSSADPSYGAQGKENEILLTWWQDICSVFETTGGLEVLVVIDSTMVAPFMQIFTRALRQPRCKLPRLHLRYANHMLCEDLSCVLTENKHLRQLWIEHTRLAGEAMKSLCRALRSHHCLLQSVRLEHCEATFKDWFYLASYLQRNAQLRTLLMRQNCLPMFSVNYLLASHLRELALEKCNITKFSCEGIAFALRHSKMLTHLSLAENNLRDAGSRHIWRALKYLSCPLQRLVLRQCSLTSACGEYMTSALKNNKGLRSLDLSCNRLSDDGVILLCDALADADSNVSILELEWCSFTSHACHAIASMLVSHRKLMYLDLSKNVIGVSGILTLSLAFLSHRQGEDVILKKSSNDRVDMYTRLKGPQVEDSCLKVVQDWNS
ncbi:NACHT, LRR and PYD domains-containing protein 8 isoform X2 [Mesocricetus auratus]|uniref:NACHT, LRR and PYD domains-containing protein 8 isoform X2 n=1 Tax=Mesocricetus auratus TaxID=10036 RepID=A0ABM2WGD7_MESAU|nr:NACHT, LRR and PYD domains-containing protein 8 isoform X2 [Mesocricetus auratus]